MKLRVVNAPLGDADRISGCNLLGNDAVNALSALATSVVAGALCWGWR